MAGLTSLRLAAEGPFDHRGALGVLSAHRIDGLTRIAPEACRVTRLLEIGGRAEPVQCTLDGGGVTVAVADPELLRGGAASPVGARISEMFDLGADVLTIDEHLSRDPVFADQIAVRPGMRITRMADPFEAVVLTVLGQQVTLAAGRLFGSRLVAAFGTPGPAGLMRFPAPRVLARVPPGEVQSALRVTRARARTVLGVAAFFADRGPWVALPAREDLAPLYGIGRWTLDYLAVRSTTDPDVFPESDAVLRRMVPNAGTVSELWRPYRSYAAVRLWAMSGSWPAVG
ncbi:DNA-3-methyladenine glycosylase family protein [Gordonia neofelifaecis]|uniref:3-methyladenine DNA glycosylase/8-oxoguanine DNA glycosylase n=1 Tax=Gordonia neofelifaecis NRRL B-59395 TaxID=644548 RepID=F1YHZ6_9ACTN|nr:AlkA N-terminal domain-containing protein [Gordonia neofelifaecis]EGD55550.1 3-methyladenine DNA glycosylase/8-oxoguanine DNA glycosylase [Gordonia neofelifaecis NRRL B-59395]